jgi:hypothetical protein
MDKITLNHIVCFDRDGVIYAAGREQENNHIRIFLVRENEGTCYSRNGRTDSWEELYGTTLGEVIGHILLARNARKVPVYRINDYFNA